MASNSDKRLFNIIGVAGSIYPLPSCISSSAVTSLQLSYMEITNFDYIGTSLQELELTSCSLGTTNASATGFTSSGEVDFGAIWERFTTITSFKATYLTATGSLPTTLPALMQTLTLANTGLTGSLSSSLLYNYQNSNAPSTVAITITGNTLSGGFNPAIMTYISSMTTVTSLTLDFSNNQLSGTINSGSFGLGSVTSFSLILASNSLNGAFPSGWFTGTPMVTSFNLDFSSNHISTLPSYLFANGFTPSSDATASGSFSVDFSNNGDYLTGTLSSGILMNGLTQNASFYSLSLSLSGNSLSGTVPNALFHVIPSTKRDIAAESDADEALESTATSAVFITGNIAALNLAFNDFAGTVPDNIMELAVATSSFFSQLTFSAGANQFTGPLPSQCPSAVQKILIYIASNSLTGTIPNSWASCNFSSISIEYNTALTGTVPKGLLLRGAQYFLAESTSLYGNLPTLPSTLASVNLGSTNIDFCSDESKTAFSTFTSANCNFASTATCSCATTYSQCTTVSCTPGIPLYEYPEPTAIVPSAPVPTSTPVKAPAPVACPGTKPSTDFDCVNGIWTASSVSTPTLVIPSGTGTVVITGSLTVSSILLSGLSSSVSVSGCATNLSDIHVDLDKTDVETLGSSTLHSLISSSASSNCSTEYSNIALTTSVSGKSCRKVSVAKSTSSDGSTLSGLFTVDKSSCNTWWIIVISVVAGVVVLAVVLLIIIFACVPACRQKARPYSKPRKGTQPEV